MIYGFMVGVIVLRECSVALLSEQNNCLTLVYMKTLLVWDCRVIYAATELYIYSLHLIFYADFKVTVLLINNFIGAKVYCLKVAPLCFFCVKWT